MTVFYNDKRSKWSYDFRLNGKRQSGYCIHPDTAVEAKTEKQARDVEAFVRDRLGRRTNAPTRYGCSLAETAEYHLENHAKHLATWSGVLACVRELLEYFGAATDINAISDEDVAEYANWSREQTKKIWMSGPKKQSSYDSKNLKSTGKKREPATVNKYLKVLKQIFNTPVARKHCKHPPNIKLLKEPKRIPTPIDHVSAEKILKNAPPHLQKTIILCIHTGMRETEALTVRASQFVEDQMMINLDATTKARKGRQVPVNSVAFEIIKQCRVLGDELWEQLKSNRKMADDYAKKYGIKTRGDIPFILFSQPWLDGKKILRPVQSIKKAWITARRKAELQGKARFHDTRASFCSYLAQLGVNVLDIQQLAGHESVSTTMRYIGVGNTNLRNAVDLLARMRPLEVQNQSQNSAVFLQDSHTKVTDRRVSDETETH